MPQVNRVKKSRKAQGNCGKCGCPINAGDAYVWWKFKVGGIRKRCANPACAPRASDLTQSEFLGRLCDLQDRILQCRSCDELLGLAKQVRELGSEQEDKLSNMPDSLRHSPTGAMLRERAEYCSEWADNLENHVHDFEEADLEDEDAFDNWAVLIPDYPGQHES